MHCARRRHQIVIFQHNLDYINAILQENTQVRQLRQSHTDLFSDFVEKITFVTRNAHVSNTFQASACHFLIAQVNLHNVTITIATKRHVVGERSPSSPVREEEKQPQNTKSLQNGAKNSMNQVLIDHDGTASTDFDDKTKTSPQVLAVIARLRVALEKLDGAVVETRACLDGRLSPAREIGVIGLLRNVHNIASSLYVTMPASNEEVTAKLRRKPRKALPPIETFPRSTERKHAIELADRALLDLHYLQLKLRGHPPLDMKKLLAVAIIARDLERVMFEEVRRGEQLGHEGTESVEGTEDFSEDLARKQSLSAKLETAGDAINRVRMLVATLHTVVRRVRMHTAGALTKELRNTRKQLELFLDQNRLARPKSSLPHESGGGAANKLDATRRALTASLDQISQAAGIVFQWVASHDNDANAASFVECLRSLGNKLRALCPTSDRRRRAPAAPAIAAPSAVPLVSTRAGANEEDDDDDDDDDDGIGGDIDDDDDDDDDDEELAVMGAHAGKAGAAVSTLVMGGTIRTVSSMPELLDDLEVHVNNTGSDEPSQSSSTQAEFIDAASRTEAN